MNKYPEAVSYFKKALVLDPENDTYKSNLKIAEQKQKEASSPVSHTHSTACQSSAIVVVLTIAVFHRSPPVWDSTWPV